MMIKNGNLLKIFAGGDFFSKYPIRVTIDILPDPTITVEDMIDYGYFHADVLPLRCRNALILSDAGFPILELFEDNSDRDFDETDMSEFEIHHRVGGIWGIRKDVWYSYLDEHTNIGLFEDLWLSESPEDIDPEQHPILFEHIAPQFPRLVEPNMNENEFGVDHFEDGEDPFNW